MSENLEHRVLGDRYELLEQIGSGGMAYVYKAMDLRLNRHVAVKILKSEFIENKSFVQKFSDEAMSAASLTHPNIVSIFDTGHDGDLYYIVMELVNGITLKDLIDRKKTIKWKDALSITGQILSALEVAHKNNIIHRDIKPHNIMLTYDGTAKVADFGIARVVSTDTRETSDMNIGSVHYLSPEQAKGESCDERSDLYSIGITLYEMLIGQVPFDGETAISVAMQHIRTPMTPPCELNPAIPVGVSDFVLKATQKEPKDRFQSAMNMMSSMQVVLLIPNEHLQYQEQEKKISTEGKRVVSPAKGTEVHRENDPRKVPQKAPGKVNEQKKKVPFAVWLKQHYREAIVAVGAFVLAIVVFVLCLGSISGNLAAFRLAEYAVEDFTGQNYSEVAENIRELGIQVEITYTASSTVPKDVIMSQTPSSGIIQPGDTITMNVSYGSSDFVISNYGASQTDIRIVENDFRNTGVSIVYIYEYSNTVAKDYVITTRPGTGEILNAGDTLYVYRSLGAPEYPLTSGNYVGMAPDDAKKAIEANGLKCVILEKIVVETPEQPAVSATPSASLTTSQSTGTGDALFESPTPTPTPTATIGGGIAETLAPDETPTPELVVAQYPPVGTVLEEGDAVILYLSAPELYRTTTTLILERSDNMNISNTFDLRIEMVGSDTQTTEVLFQDVWQRSNFPFVFEAQVPYRGQSEVSVYINDTFYCKYILKSDE